MGYGVVLYTVFGYLIPEEVIKQIKRLEDSEYEKGGDYWGSGDGEKDWEPEGLKISWTGHGASEIWAKAIGVEIIDLNDAGIHSLIRADALDRRGRVFKVETLYYRILFLAFGQPIGIGNDQIPFAAGFAS